MRYLAKLGAAAGMAVAIGVLQAPVADALPIGPIMRYCEWDGRYYKPGSEVEVTSPDGTVTTYRCDPNGTGEWEKVSYSSSYGSWYGYMAYL